jgi:asparagine synthase (glutamine-hydrolysing)
VSGIAVLYERGGAAAAEARLARMLERLRHRGPDRRSHLCLGPVALGQCMLETTPEDALDQQPLRAASAARWIIADARLDNREELLSAGRAAGDVAEPVSDAGLILWAYERWGEDCPERLIGDFAFVIWDGEARRLFCARDHLGVRPLYYHHDGRALRAASEMNALFADERVPRRLCRRETALFLTYQYTEAKATLWEGISALSPGHRLTVTSAAIREEPYWRLDPSRRIRHRDDASYADHFKQVFSEAVRCRLRSSRPLGAQVSGGLDSSSVACEAERLRREGCASGDPVLLMRCLFPGMECDERRYSQAVADHLGLPIVAFAPPEDPEICRPAPEPFDPDCYFDPTVRAFGPLLEVARQRGVRSILTGVGGDHLMRRTGLERADAVRKGRLGAAARMAGLSARPFSLTGWKTLLRDGITAFVPPRVMRPLRRLRHPPRARWPWVSAKVARVAMEHQEAAAQRDFERYPEPVTRDLVRQLADGLNSSLPLAQSDRLAARAGAEFRHPFFDVRLVELLLAFPHAQRFDGEIEKPVLRRAMVGVVPALVRERREITYFTSYVRRCLFEEHHGAIRELLEGGLLEQASLLDRAEVRRLLLGRGSDQVLSLLNPLALEIWLRQSLKAGSASAVPGTG